MSYYGIICEAKVRPHPNADRLQLCDCFGETVIVGIDVREGDLGIYFPTDGQLSEEFCIANDLLKRKDENGQPAGGMFGVNRRVKTVKLRGVISNGFWCPIYYLWKVARQFPIAEVKHGDKVSEFGGVPICNKYETLATKNAAKQGKLTRGSLRNFPKHMDTEQLAYNVHKIPIGALLIITSKMHGTSGRAGYIKVPRQLSKWQQKINRFLSRWGLTLFPEEKHEYVHGSRNVILSSRNVFANDFHSHGLRDDVASSLGGKLHENEVVFFEVVGWDGSRPIMKPGDTSKLQDKSFSEAYGNPMYWSYGLPAGRMGIYIYRIAYDIGHGKLIDLPWFDVKRRAAEMELPTVPDIDYFFYDGNEQGLLNSCRKMADGKDLLGNHWREGIVVRVDGVSPSFYKMKNEIFKYLESIRKDDPTDLDIEEAA